MSKSFIINRTLAIILVAALLAYTAFVSIVVSKRPIPTSCSTLANEGRTNIRQGNPDYNPALDRDKDGIACEK